MGREVRAEGEIECAGVGGGEGGVHRFLLSGSHVGIEVRMGGGRCS